jgi:uncharacterized protein (TIGR03083 family)
VAAVGELYAQGRGRISALVVGLGEEDVDRPVLTCPGWSVGDVVAHLAGVCTDVLAGNVAGVASDPWTEAQVRARRGRPIAEVVEEWSQAAPQVEALSSSFPGRMGEQWVADLITHEHDVRTALGRPGARDSEGLAVGLGFLVEMGLESRFSELGLPALEVRAGDRGWTVGGGQPTGTLDATAFGLFRALTGRRSRTQIRAFAWTVAPDPYLPGFQFGPFTASEADVVE